MNWLLSGVTSNNVNIAKPRYTTNRTTSIAFFFSEAKTDFVFIAFPSFRYCF